MKSKIIIPIIFFVLLLATSCKKESSPAIVGKWMCTAVYSERDGWVTEMRFPEVVTFESDAQFSVFTDVPGGAGKYSYSRSSNELQLQYEADRYGNPSRSALQKVETLTNDKLIIAREPSVNGMMYKTEYARIN